MIGAATTRGLGSGHDPALAARALEESRDQIEQLIEKYSVVITIGTGGKGTGAGTMFPLADIVRRQHKLVLPVFVRPSFERHEVDKRRYDHAIDVAAQFDSARIRLIEILNDRAYSDRDPQPQSVVWERMNLPIARGLRGLIYVLWDLSQVDPSDLSTLLAGDGRMRIGFGEIDPPDGEEPADAQIGEAVDRCWQNPYCTFSRPAGTSLVCIQGDWSNLADAKIKSGIAALALESAPRSRYNPLYARAVHTPRPWGVSALFAEYTGVHEPLTLEWTLKPSLLNLRLTTSDAHSEPVVEAEGMVGEATGDGTVGLRDHQLRVSRAALVAAGRVERTPGPPFATVADFAKALNRLDPIALELAAGDPLPDMAVDGLAVKQAARHVLVPVDLPTPLPIVARALARNARHERRDPQSRAVAGAARRAPCRRQLRRTEGDRRKDDRERFRRNGSSAAARHRELVGRRGAAPSPVCRGCCARKFVAAQRAAWIASVTARQELRLSAAC